MSELLKEIAENWKLEAKQENNSRYFYYIDEATKILNGERFYVIGRKESGKTAIGEYVLNLNQSSDNYNVFSEKLSFKNFPFNELYALENAKYTQPNQYITIWKYIIYSCICRLMVKNQNIDGIAREVLEKLYPSDPIKNLSRLIGNWTMKEFGAQIAGIGGNIKVDNISTFDKLSWIEKTNILEDIIDKYIDDARYYVVFDELDEDYRVFEDATTQKQYVNLITSLFKAVQDIKAIFKEKKDVICPIVFLRDDIYALVQDTDKNKWGDFIISLDWNEDKIQKLLAFRISRAIDTNSNNLTFSQAWNEIFENRPVYMGNRQTKPMNIFDFMTRSTQIRPRDYIKYIQVCAEKAVSDRKTKISPDIVKVTDDGFSNYLKDEIIDETHAQLSDIQMILSIISQIRKQTFTIEEFKKTYLDYLRKKTVQEKNIEYVLQMLFHFSVIGNKPRNRAIHFFKYIDAEARFNFNEIIVVHRGLFKALQII